MPSDDAAKQATPAKGEDCRQEAEILHIKKIDEEFFE
jgi:hypothetical protein